MHNICIFLHGIKGTGKTVVMETMKSMFPTCDWDKFVSQSQITYISNENNDETQQLDDEQKEELDKTELSTARWKLQVLADTRKAHFMRLGFPHLLSTLHCENEFRLWVVEDSILDYEMQALLNLKLENIDFEDYRQLRLYFHGCHEGAFRPIDRYIHIGLMCNPRDSFARYQNKGVIENMYTYRSHLTCHHMFFDYMFEEYPCALMINTGGRTLESVSEQIYNEITKYCSQLRESND